MKCALQAAKALVVMLASVVVLSSFNIVYASEKPRCHKTVPKPFVCLTVDDGFNSACIRSILKTLKKHDVKCTFFVVGAYLLKKDNQPLWQQAVRDGHEICYHTMRHKRATAMKTAEIKADIAAWEAVAHKVLGESYVIPKFARLPGGAGSSDGRILAAYDECGYSVIRWNVDTLTGPANRKISIKDYVRRVTGQGSVILTHFSSGDASALPGYIGWLKKKFNLCRISEAFAPPVLSEEPLSTPAQGNKASGISSS